MLALTFGNPSLLWLLLVVPPMVGGDTPGPMVAPDVQPPRLSAPQQSARAFLKQVPSPVKVGLVAFASEVRLVAPPTTDRETVRQGLSPPPAVGATAMGDAINL